MHSKQITVFCEMPYLQLAAFTQALSISSVAGKLKKTLYLYFSFDYVTQ